MKPLYTQPAEFWRERDFGAKISAAFDFIGAHWRLLGKCLVYFVLPSALLMGIGLGIFTNGLFDYASNPNRFQTGLGKASPFNMFNFWGLGLGMLGSLVSVVMLSATVYGYLRLRLRLPAHELVQPRDVWQAVRARLGWVLLAGFVFFVGGYIGFTMLFGLLFVGLAALQLGPWAVLLAMLLGMAPLVYVLVVALSLYLPVLWLEDRGVFGALGRCFQLIKGQWWATFGLLLVTLIIQSSLLIVFVVPQYAVIMGKAMHVPFLNSDILGIAAQCFYALGIMFTYTVPMLVLAFQYFNLVELHEGFGSRLLLANLGQSGQLIPHENAYSPDEEGEY